MHPIVPKLGARVRYLRESAGLTQAHVAEACGVAVQTISRVERGVKAPSLEVVAGLASALGVHPAALFAFDGVVVGDDKGPAAVIGGLPTDAVALRRRVERAVRVLAGEE